MRGPTEPEQSCRQGEGVEPATPGSRSKVQVVCVQLTEQDRPDVLLKVSVALSGEELPL